jgi:hypothetical protein
MPTQPRFARFGGRNNASSICILAYYQSNRNLIEAVVKINARILVKFGVLCTEVYLMSQFCLNDSLSLSCGDRISFWYELAKRPAGGGGCRCLLRAILVMVFGDMPPVLLGTGGRL